MEDPEYDPSPELRARLIVLEGVVSVMFLGASASLKEEVLKYLSLTAAHADQLNSETKPGGLAEPLTHMINVWARSTNEKLEELMSAP